jgi:hypothetical protein
LGALGRLIELLECHKDSNPPDIIPITSSMSVALEPPDSDHPLFTGDHTYARRLYLLASGLDLRVHDLTSGPRAMVYNRYVKVSSGLAVLIDRLVTYPPTILHKGHDHLCTRSARWASATLTNEGEPDRVK